MLGQYLDTIKAKIRKHKSVKAHPQLKSKKWTKSCYARLSEIVSDFLMENLSPEDQMKMGTTISSKTLSNIYTGKYKLSYPIDPRTLNTLTKLVYFIGYESWEAFEADVESTFKKTKIKGKTKEC